MLVDIAIENLGVIPQASAELAPGLTVLTGETGAGKTMVVTGLRLLTGARAEVSRVRSGSPQAVVEARLSAEGMPETVRTQLTELLEASGGTVDENGEYLLSRTVSAAGRSRAHLGGRAVPAATLAEFSSHLLTIHGQNDQLRLLAPEQQLAALDRFDPTIAPLYATYREHFRTYRRLAKDYKARTESRRELAQEIDRLQFALDEINTINPQAGEEEALLTEIKRLQDVDTLREQAETALISIDGADALGGQGGSELEAASALLGAAESELLGSVDPALKELGERLAEITSALGDIAGELGNFLSSLPIDASSLEEKLQRQSQLKILTRKYAPDLAGVIAWRAQAEKRLASIDISTEALEELKNQMHAEHAVLLAAAEGLSQARREAAARLSEAVTTEIRGLAMPKARLHVEVSAITPAKDGADAVELQLAPNDTTGPLPLAQAASGGELSRVMLALEVVLSADSSGATMVFDEVDAGVGGRAAVEIGRRLARLAARNQVIVVTHLAQVAAYADRHMHVAKEVSDEAVTSGVAILTQEQRIEELARMLAGLDDTDTGRAHAQELLERAQAERDSFRAPTSG